MSEPTGWTTPGDSVPDQQQQPTAAAYPPPAGAPVPAEASGGPSWFAPPPVWGLGVAVLGVSGLYLVAKVAECFLAFPAEDQLRAGERGPALALYGGVSILESVVLVVAWVMASVWLMRLHRAAAAVSPGSMRRSTVWTWLGWWVPFVSLWFPKQIVDDVWRVAGAQPGRTGAGTTGGWWSWWLATVITDRIASSTFGTGGGGSGFLVLSTVFAVIASWFWFRVVRGVSAAHDAGPWTPDAPVPARPTGGAGYGTN